MLKQTRRTPTTAGDELERFLDYPPRMDMQNFLHLYSQGHTIILERFLGHLETTLIICETPIYPYVSRNQNVRIPDLMIAFDVDAQRVIDEGGYAINHHGKPPELVLEVASPSNPQNDLVRKRQDYQAFGIPEYWRFDPTGGQRYDVGLAGERLVNGVYQSVFIHHDREDDLYWGRSAMLGLDICWQSGRLLWWDPAAERYLGTVQEWLDAGQAAGWRAEQEGQARQAAEERAEQEGQARQAAEERAEQERQARQAAEERAEQLEAELRRRNDEA